MAETRKVILVTGGSAGLGKSICVRLAGQGHIVYGTSRKVQAEEPTGAYQMLQMDVTDASSVQKAVERVLAKESRIDVLVNNAGLGIQGPVEDISPELAQRLFDTNVWGPHRVWCAVLPTMRKQGAGLIINISSVAANFGLPYRGFYSASKAALDRLSEALSTEVHQFGINVVTVQPGEFNTTIGDSRLRPEKISNAHRPGYEKAMEVLGGSMHYSRDPDELAQVVEQIIQTKEPKARYVVAQGMQRVSILAKKFLPGRMFEKMLRKHYE